MARAHAATGRSWSPSPGGSVSVSCTAATTVTCTAATTVTVDSTARGLGPAILIGRIRREGEDAGQADGIAGAVILLTSLNLGSQAVSDGTFELVVPAASLATPRADTVSLTRSVGATR